MEPIDSLWDFNQPAASEARFRSLLPSLAGDDPVRLELLTQIARAQGLQRHFAEAGATLDEVERALERTSLPRAAIRYRLERGRVANSRGDRGEAHPWFVAAWEAARDAGEDALAIDAAHMVAIAGDVDERMAWNRRALRLADESAQPGAVRWRASLLNNLGWAHMDRGEHADALDSFERAVVARQAMGDVGAERIARWAVARAQRALGRLDEALSAQHALAAEWEAAGERDGYVEEEIAECLLAMGHADRAAPHFARAYEALRDDPDLAAHHSERLARMRERSAG